MKAAVAEYMKMVQANVLKGFRVPVGEQFITVYPNLNASVKDTEDKQGNKTVATAKMLTANKGRSRLGASVSIKFSQEFASQVSWQKVDERTGVEIRSPKRTSPTLPTTTLAAVALHLQAVTSKGKSLTRHIV